MRLTALAGVFVLAASYGLASGIACMPGTLQNYIDLGAAGCSAGVVQFSSFYLAPGQSFAIPIDPTSIMVTPDGTASSPSLEFSVNSGSEAGQLRESFLHFAAAGPQLSSASIALGALSGATGDGLVLASMDICPGAAFAPDEPTGCPNSLSLISAVFDDPLGGPPPSSDSATLGPANSFDIFLDLTADGGFGGGASLDSATVGIVAAEQEAVTPEPDTIALTAAGLAVVAIAARLAQNAGSRRPRADHQA